MNGYSKISISVFKAHQHCFVSTKGNASLHLRPKPKYGYFGFTIYKNGQSVAWYAQLHSIAAFRKTVKLDAKLIPCMHHYPERRGKLNNLGKVKNRTGRRRPWGSEQTVQKGSTYFNQHTTGFLRRAEANLARPLQHRTFWKTWFTAFFTRNGVVITCRKKK